MVNFKAKLIFVFLFLFSLSIMARLFYLQIEKGKYYEALALGQQISFEEIKGERGEIFLNNGQNIFAQTKKKILIYVFPEQIAEEKTEETIEILADLLGEKKESLLSFFNKGEVIKREISQETLDQIEKYELSGVQPEEVWGRIYPQKELAGHLVGFLNQDGQGQYGLEGFYNEVLKGTEIFQQKGKSPFGYLALTEMEVPDDIESSPKGADIFLTLDYNIQYFAEKLLAETKESMKIDSGQIIVTEPSSGKILALAVFPSFDPNQYNKEKNLAVFINPVLQSLFEPGSVFKPITFAAAIEENLIEPDDTYEDKGSVSLGGPPIYNYNKRVWGEQKMTDVLEESINTGAVYVQQKLGRELFLEYLEKFGLFEETAVDLQGEVYSINETLKNGYPRDLATASFGQGVEITPIQIIRAFGAIANGGNLMKPYLVEKIVKSSGQITEAEPEIQKKVISSSSANTLASMLISVVENGSGRKAKISGYLIAGKTGTAQVPLKTGGYSETETIQSFVGFFPALDPQFLVFIKLDNPETGTAEYSAVPVFSEMAKYIIDYKQIPPSY